MQRISRFIVYILLLIICKGINAQVAKIVVENSGNEDILCTDLVNGCAALIAQHIPSRKTTSYNYTEIPYKPIGDLSTLGEKVSLDRINEYSDSIEIGFNFNYYNQNYTSLLINENGFLSFDFRNIGLVDVGKPLKAVMGVYQDLVIVGDDKSAIYYKVEGVAPQREFVVTYYNALAYFCNNSKERSTTQIRLKELTNEIEVHVLEKSINCGEGLLSVLGITNDNYNNSLFVIGKENNDQWTANKIAYKFSPQGNSVVTYQWYKNSTNKLFSTSNKVNICPIKEDEVQYNLIVTYNNKPKYVEKDSINVKIPILKDLNLQICNSSNLNLNELASKMIINNVVEDFNFKFYDGNNLVTEPTQFNFTEVSKTVKVVTETVSGKCISEANLILDTNSIHKQINEEIEICDNIYRGNGEGVETGYNLSNLSTIIFEDHLKELNNNIDLKYYLDESLNSNLPNITNLANNDVLYLGYESNDGCKIPLGKIIIKLISPPKVLALPNLLEVKLCDINFNKIEDFVDENGNSLSLVEEFIKAGLRVSEKNVKISIFSSYQDALKNTGAIEKIKTNDINSIQEYFIRVDSSCEGDNCKSCFSIFNEQAKVKIAYYGVDLKSINTQIICAPSGSTSFDLSCLKEKLFNKIYKQDGSVSDDINELKITYHNSKADAEAGRNEINSNLGGINLGLNTYYLRYELCNSCAQGKKSCYSIKPVNLLVINNRLDNDNVDICIGEGGSVVINPDVLNKQIFDQPNYYVIKYYNSKQDAENNNDNLVDIELKAGTELYAKVIIKNAYLSLPENCTDNKCSSFIQKIKINTSTDANFTNNLIITEQVCNNDLSGKAVIDLTNYKDLILQKFNNPADYEVNFFLGNNKINNPRKFSYTIPDEDKPDKFNLYAKVTSKFLDCDVIVPITLNLSYQPNIYIDNWTACACLPSLPIRPYVFSGDEVKELIAYMYNEKLNKYNLEDIEVSFYSNIYGKGYDNAFKKINPIEDNDLSTEEFELDSEIQINNVFVRFENKNTGCFSIGELELKNLLLPNVRPNEYKVCDNDFDGVYEVNLTALDEYVLDFGDYTPIFINGGNFQFSYFTSLKDAQNLTNPIIPIKAPADSDYYWEIDFSLLKENKIWIRVDTDKEGLCQNVNFNKDNCKSIESVRLVPNEKRISNQFNSELSITYCEDNATLYPSDFSYNDGIITDIDLTQIETELKRRNSNIDSLIYYKTKEDMLKDDFGLGKNSIAEPKSYTNIDMNGSALKTFFVKYNSKDKNECSNYIEANINILESPVIYPDKEYFMCPNTYINIDLNNPNNENLNDFEFIWIDPDGITTTNSTLIKSTKFGEFKVQITNKITGCSTPYFKFEVVPTSPPEIESIEVENRTATIIAKGLDNFDLEYSLEGVEWQKENIFTDLTPGIKTFYVRYDNYNKNCIGEPKETVILDLDNVITPNGDGKNDFWEVKNLEVFEGDSSIQIFDRNGLKVYEDTGKVIKWNGKTNNGQKLPTTDYWYILRLFDGRTYKGHITLKNK